MHSDVFNLISLFTQTQRDERRMELTALIISTHLPLPLCQNCISIFPSISILPVVSKGKCRCGRLGPDLRIKQAHNAVAASGAAEANGLVQQLQDDCALKRSMGPGISALCFHLSVFRQTPELDGWWGWSSAILQQGKRRKAQLRPVIFYM